MEIEATGERQYFNPHPFDYETLKKIILENQQRQNGADEYWVGLVSGELVSYGLLRGWSEGYLIPSLGIAIAPRFRGLGYAKNTLEFLHLRAHKRGAEKIRLKVNRHNKIAINIYRKVGYVLSEYNEMELIGWCVLTPRRTSYDQT